MKVIQTNRDNTFGFARLNNLDIGVDEKGEIAQGYQHHDALWWKDSPIKRDEATTTLDMDSTLQSFNIIFSNIANNIAINFAPKTVLELGCGNGQLANMLRNFGIQTVTVDANREVLGSPFIDENHFLARTDKPLHFQYENGEPVVFDMVISLEHFEHVSPETFDVLMQNILNHTHQGSHLIFTAAAWEYDGDKDHIHCNAKPKEYWQEYISKHGFEEMQRPFNLNRGGNTCEMFSVRKD